MIQNGYSHLKNKEETGMKKIMAGFVLILAMVAGLILTAPTQTNAMSAADLEDVEIAMYHFTTQAIGVGGGGVATASIKNPDLGRYIIVTLKAAVPNEEINLCANEFSFIFTRKDGSEYKAACIGICVKQEFISPPIFYFGDNSCAEAKTKNSVAYIELFGYIEPEVISVKILRAGSSGKISCRVGERKLSVRLYTNGPSLEQIENMVINSDCDTFCSGDLVESHRGLTIRYAPHASEKAKEIANALKKNFGLSAEIKKLEGFLSVYDILIWVGKDCLVQSDTQNFQPKKSLVFY